MFTLGRIAAILESEYKFLKFRLQVEKAILLARLLK